jgi:hypothetical protein
VWITDLNTNFIVFPEIPVGCPLNQEIEDMWPYQQFSLLIRWMVSWCSDAQVSNKNVSVWLLGTGSKQEIAL